MKQLVEYKPKSKKTDIMKSLSTLNNKLKRKSVIYIISDFISDTYDRPLKFLKLHHQVILINISDVREKQIPEIWLCLFGRCRNRRTNTCQYF